MVPHLPNAWNIFTVHIVLTGDCIIRLLSCKKDRNRTVVLSVMPSGLLGGRAWHYAGISWLSKEGSQYFLREVSLWQLFYYWVA